jgi:hypothetical protein
MHPIEISFSPKANPPLFFPASPPIIIVGVCEEGPVAADVQDEAAVYGARPEGPDAGGDLRHPTVLGHRVERHRDVVRSEAADVVSPGEADPRHLDHPRSEGRSRG